MLKIRLQTATVATITLFFVTATSTLGRTVADSLFLSHFSTSDLSKIYLPQAILLFLTALAYQKLSEKLRLDHLSYVLMGTAVFFSLVCFPIVQLQKLWIIPFIYISYDAFNFLSLILSWQLITASLDPRIAKKKISFIGSGGLIGGIVSGLTLRNFSYLIEIEYLVLIYALLQAVLILFFYLLKKSSTLSLTKVSHHQSSINRKILFQKIPHLGQISLMMGTLTISLTLLDFQFKFLLGHSIGKANIPSFMGTYYAMTGILALTIQLIFTSVVIRKLGLTSVLLLLPIILLFGSAALFVIPILSIAVFLKGADRVIGDTLHSSAMQLLMFPIESEYRSSAKAFLDGTIRNGSKAIAATLLMIFGFLTLPIKVLAILVVILVSISIYAAFKMRKSFLQTLIQSIDHQKFKEEDFTLTELDGTSSRILISALQGEDQLHALSALKFLKNFPKFDILPYIPKLLNTNHPQIQIEVLKYLQVHPTPHLKDLIFKLAKIKLEDIEIFYANQYPIQQAHQLELQGLILKTELKAEAILTIAAYAYEEDLDFFSQELKSESFHVKIAAVTALVKNFSLEGMFRSIDTLKNMLQSPNSAERALVARLFGKLNIEEFYQPLIPLLKDNELSVRIAALDSCTELKVPQLIPHIKQLLKSPLTRNQCAQALSIYEESMLISALKPDWKDPTLYAYLPAVWKYFRSEESVSFILDIYHDANEEFKTYLSKIMVQMSQKSVPFPYQIVNEEIFIEVKIYHIFKDFLSLIMILPVEERNLFVLVEEGINRDCNQSMRRIFHLLSLIYPHDLIEKAFTHLHKSETIDDFLDIEQTSSELDINVDLQSQANSLEILEQILYEPVRTAILSLFEESKFSQTEFKSLAQIESEIDQKISTVYEVAGVWLKDCLISLMHQEKGRFQHSEEGLALTIKNQIDQAIKKIELVDLLNQATLFKSLSNEEKSLIAQKLVKCEFHQNEVILQQYDRGDYLLILAQGTVSIEKGDLEICTLGVGACFGETALIDAGPRTATVRSKSHTVLWRLDSGTFFEILFDRNDMSMTLMKILAQRLRTELQEKDEHADHQPVQQVKKNMSENMVPTQSAIFSKEISLQFQQELQQELQSLKSEIETTPIVQQRSQSLIYEQENQNRLTQIITPNQFTPIPTENHQNADRLLIEKMHRMLLLQNIPLFSFLNLQELTLLSSKIEERKFKVGHKICIEGQRGNGMYGVIRGKISVQKGKQEIALLDSGDFFGEMSLIDSSPRSATCVALEEATLLYIRRSTVFTFCFERPDALREMMRVLVRRLRILEMKKQGHLD